MLKLAQPQYVMRLILLNSMIWLAA